MEAIGETDTAKGYYRAIINDFSQLAKDIRAAPELWATAEDIVAMGALRDAYEGMNRLSSVTKFSAELAFLRRLLERGASIPPDQDKDEPTGDEH